ncbi:putative collagen-binding protein [Terriglobus roseus DSM 18391]|uniref:Putative collagen-binding protein n=1 Tax=Terriglobus roseus (strain DSM 18391 / NRRL B-41598 / KBS 63) TaxID=926566 RepID=I3ZHR3_TERRK|nr:carboxypeptidase-like regulatory domain-containing protein [Terriglobus roseus]AFL88439.1 putative collagen-binding protein [Terriglobus roseus DSM 18391]AFL88781.1 putative collagen-binding protein [Terriglobus roseus DSM 18391]
MKYPSPRSLRRRIPAGARFLLPLAIVCTGTASAQFRASISGTVSDGSGAVVPGAAVTLTDLQTNRVMTTTSNESGVYTFNGLAPDQYKISVALDGFSPKELNNLSITPDAPNSVNVQLGIASQNTSVDVTSGSAPVLETATATISGTINENQIQHLPAAGRDVFQLTQLAPGVFGDGAQASSGTSNSNLPGTAGPGAATRSNGIFQTENAPQANANGGQNGNNSITIDGVSTVSAVWGGASIITPSQDSVGSVRVVSNGYDAENGRFSGAQIQVNSKTGTNRFHGSLFLRANRPGLNAYQRYNGPGTFNPGTPADRGLLRDATRSNQFGGSIGGPILRDRLFFFFNYETQRDHTSVPGTGWFETSQYAALAPAGSIAATYLNFAGNAPVNATQINQTCSTAGFQEGVNCRTVGGALNLGSPVRGARGTQDTTWVSNSNPGVGGGLTNTPTIAQYSFQNPTTQVGQQFNGRLDGDVTKKDHLAFAIYWVPLSRTNQGGPGRVYDLFNHNQINDAYTVIWNHIFSPNLLNEARANDAGYRWNEVSSNPQAPFGLPTSTVDTLGANNISVGYYGAPGPSVLNQHTYNFKDVATLTTGNHILKFGGEATRLYYLNNPTSTARPAYNFYNMWAFLNDAPHSESGAFLSATGTPGTNRQDERTTIWGFFAQDDWKATPNLTLNMGLRWSYFGPLNSKQNNIGVVEFGQGSAMYTGMSVRTGGPLSQAQKANFGPQFGFAWNPEALKHRVVLRGGYGLNFNQNEIAIQGNSGNNPPYILNASYNNSRIVNGVATIDPKIVYSVASDPKSLFGYPANPNAVGGFNAANLPTAGGASVVAFPSTVPTIYTQHFSLDTQFELPLGLVATVGYQGSLTRHLIVQSQAYVRTYTQGYAVNPLVSNLAYFTNTGTANNNQLLAGLRKQMSHGFSIDASFQWAKTMDQGSSPYYTDPYSFNPSLAYGRSDYNFGKAAKVFGMWQPRFFKGHGFAHSIADGWTVSGIYNFHTGFPFTPTYNVPGGNLYYGTSGYTTLRPTFYSGTGGKNHSVSAMRQTQGANVNFPLAGAGQPYFGVPATGIPAGGGGYGLPSLPGVARNTLDGPNYQDLDASLAKNFALPGSRFFGESTGLEFRMDAFNVLNLTNLNPGSVVTNITSSNFGTYNQGLAGRIVNLQARFSF